MGKIVTSARDSERFYRGERSLGIPRPSESDLFFKAHSISSEFARERARSFRTVCSVDADRADSKTIVGDLFGVFARGKRRTRGRETGDNRKTTQRQQNKWFPSGCHFGDGPEFLTRMVGQGSWFGRETKSSRRWARRVCDSQDSRTTFIATGNW